MVPGAIVPQVCQLPSLHLGSTAQVSLLGLPMGCLALRALQCESRVPLSSRYAISQADKEDMVVAEAEKHSFPSHTWWTASLCHWVQHCSSNHLKASHQLMCPLLSQQQQQHQQCKPLAGFPSPCFPLQLQGGPLQHKKSKLQGHLSLPGHGRPGSWCPLPFPAGSLMAAMNQQPVDLSKAFLHFNPIDRDYCLEQELRGEPCQQQILITDNIDGAFS